MADDDLTSEIFSNMDNDESSSSSVDDTRTETSKQSQIKVSKEFQENVVKFVKLDDIIAKKTKKLAELKAQRKPCEDYIIKYLDNIDEQVINITNGKIKKNKSETKGSLNADIIKKSISKKITDPVLLAEILKDMEDSRPTNTSVKLTRVGGKTLRK